MDACEHTRVVFRGASDQWLPSFRGESPLGCALAKNEWQRSRLTYPYMGRFLSVKKGLSGSFKPDVYTTRKPIVPEWGGTPIASHCCRSGKFFDEARRPEFGGLTGGTVVVRVGGSDRRNLPTCRE